MSRVLVTGGAGFIGSHVVERLLETGAQVAVVDDLSRGRREWVPPEVDLHAVDLRDEAALERVAAGTRPEVVVHLAALHFIPEVDGAPEVAWRVNVDGTKNLLEALRAAPPERVVLASTAAVYPDRAGPIPETSPAAPIDVYGATKLECERLLTRFAADTGTSCLAARLFNVIGKRETNPHVVPELVAQLRRDPSRVRLGNLTPRRDYTDVVDVADALVRLLDAAERDLFVCNVGSGIGVSVADLVSACERMLGTGIEIDADPARLRAVDRSELVADIGRLERATGWSPSRSLEQTLALLLDDAG